MKMKATHQCLAAILVAGPLCLAACGDDSNAPLDQNPPIVLPVDQAPAKSETKTAVVPLGAGGMTQHDLVVATPSLPGGSNSQVKVDKGTTFVDQQGNPVSGGDVSVSLTSYNTNADGGFKALREENVASRAASLSPRQRLNPNWNIYPVGGVMIQMLVGNTPVFLGGSSGGGSIMYCAPAFNSFPSLSISRAMGGNQFTYLDEVAPVTNGCVFFALPRGASLIPRFVFLFNGLPATGGA